MTQEALENHTGRLSMQRAANKSLIFTNLSSLKRLTETQARLADASLYQYVGVQLVTGVHSKRVFTDLGDKLVALAEQAYGLRQVQKLEELSSALLALPLPDQYGSAARYFRGLELSRRRELDAAKAVFEAVAADPPHRYTARAIQSLGVTYHARGDLDSALKLYLDAGCRAVQKESLDPLTALFTHMNIAVLKSQNGDHRGALADLERISPVARTVRPIHSPAYYDHLNSLAVELAEMGNLEEAAHASQIVISTPFAYAYPEWRQTFDDIASKQRRRASRSAVPVREHVGGTRTGEQRVGETDNVLRLPSAQHPTSAALGDRRPQGMRARILSFQQWKTMLKASSRAHHEEVSEEQRSRMTTGEKLIRLMDLISQDETDDETIDRILEAVEQIVLKRRDQKLD